MVPSPLKSIPPTKALKGGALAYEKLNPSRKRHGNCTTPARFTICVMSLVEWAAVAQPVVQIEAVAGAAAPALVPVLLEYAHEPSN